MKKLIALSILILVGFSLKGQLSDTIYAHETITTSLLFPEKISLADIGHPDFFFDYEGNLLIIKAKRPSKGTTSLLVRYGDQAYFTGYLSYRENPQRYYYDYREVSPAERPALLVDTATSLEPGPNEEPYVDTSQVREVFQRILQLPEASFARRRKKRHGLRLELEALCNSAELTLIRIRLHNESSLPYRVAYAGIEIQEKSGKRGLAGMSKEIQPVVSHLPQVIAPASDQVFAFGYSHFATSKRARLILTIREKQGMRAIELSIPGRYVLHAKAI